MKIRKILILSMCLLLIGISLGYYPIKAQSQLRVISSNTILRRGDVGTITIQGKANTNYTIRTSYMLGNREIAIAQIRASDDLGQATFNWVVDRRTALGTRKAVITGGGEMIELTHTVTE